MDVNEDGQAAHYCHSQSLQSPLRLGAVGQYLLGPGDRSAILLLILMQESRPASKS